MTPKKKATAGINANSAVEGETVAEIRGSSGVPLGNDPSVRPADAQLKTWNAAMQFFSQRRYADAAPLFRQAAQGPAVHVADKARSYEQICERQSAKPHVAFRTAEDHFYYGVERLNARDLQQAQTHLSQALQLQPEGDHILYTMALCCGFSGDGNGACENLKRAIELEPKNRVIAKQDSEFALLAQQFPALRALLAQDAPVQN